MPALHPLKLMQAMDLMNFAESQSVNDMSSLLTLEHDVLFYQLTPKYNTIESPKRKPHIALSKFTGLCWAALIAVQETMWPKGNRTGHT